MSAGLRVALVVPHHDGRSPREYAAEELRRQCHAGQIDLVVFGECFFNEVALVDVVSRVGVMADELRTPVLGGMWTTEQHIAAGFVNPRPTAGDTEQHLYLKHFSTPNEPYTLPQYGDAVDPMFRPISFRGRKLGVSICHDMFFGLLSHQFHAGGATALFNLTGENVQPTKWRCVGRGRSVEIGGAFFCTMDHKEGRTGSGFAFGYDDGVALRPIASHAMQDGTGGFHVFDWRAERPQVAAIFDHPYSPKRYTDITLGFGGRGRPDLAITVGGDSVVVEGSGTCIASNAWLGFDVRGSSVGVLTAPVEALWDPTMLYRRMPERQRFRHHIVVYHGAETPPSPERCQALAALRAVEHRVAVAVVAGDLREVMKTDNYKKVQRFREHDGVFGLDPRNLGGTWTTWRSAMSEESFPRYLSLRDAPRASLQPRC